MICDLHHLPGRQSFPPSNGLAAPSSTEPVLFLANSIPMDAVRLSFPLVGNLSVTPSFPLNLRGMEGGY